MTATASNALLADVLFGEPPEAFHPTVMMGKWISGGRRRRQRDIARRSDNRRAHSDGALLVAGGTVCAALAAALVNNVVTRLPTLVGDLAKGLALKPALSVRPLLAAARRVQCALEDGNLQDARESLARDLVSRDTSTLAAHEVAGAAIESVAENLSDSVVAPLLAFRVGGLSAAYAYRFINTADAMLGYHTEELEWFGKAAARTDDVANFVPARLTGLLICLAAPSVNGSVGYASSVVRRDARNTESPNAGWPMAAMAGALDVCLTKRNHYELHRSGYVATPSDIARACRIAMLVSAVTAVAVDVL